MSGDSANTRTQPVILEKFVNTVLSTGAIVEEVIMALSNAFCVPFYILVGYVFIVSGLIICFLMLLTYIFVWPVNRALYRKIVTSLAYTHWCQITFVAQWWSGSDCTLVVEKEADFVNVGKEHVVVIMNHKYDIEWLMSWILSERFHLLGGTKIYGKSSLRLVPLIGWAWTFTESIFLKRDWDKDKGILERDLTRITEYPKNIPVTLLLFCEGTRFTEEKHKASNAIARKKGLPELKHHLLPRTKGFVHSMHILKGKIPALYDMTIGFNSDYAKPNLLSIIQGKKCKAEIYTRRIPLDTIPTDSDEACAAWLHQLYREKDEIYEHFVQNGTFKFGKKYPVPRRATDLIVWCLWAVTLSVPLVYYAIKVIMSGSVAVQIAVLVVCFLLYKGVLAMIALSDTERGSAYGKANGKVD